jgi:hypothetical protein
MKPMSDNNKELDICKILFNKPKGLKLYSPLYGNLYLKSVDMNASVVICTKDKGFCGEELGFMSDGTTGNLLSDMTPECMLFPSKEKENWLEWATQFDKDILKIEDLMIGDFIIPYNEKPQRITKINETVNSVSVGYGSSQRSFYVYEVQPFLLDSNFLKEYFDDNKLIYENYTIKYQTNKNNNGFDISMEVGVFNTKTLENDGIRKRGVKYLHELQHILKIFGIKKDFELILNKNSIFVS